LRRCLCRVDACSVDGTERRFVFSLFSIVIFTGFSFLYFQHALPQSHIHTGYLRVGGRVKNTYWIDFQDNLEKGAC
jgi:hypothetical protein